MSDLHLLIPSDFVNGLDSLLNEVKTDMGYKEFNEESSPDIYRGLSVLYFFALGLKMTELDIIKAKGNFHHIDLLYQLNQSGLIDAKPKNYQELKTNFENLFVKTSEYLRNLK